MTRIVTRASPKSSTLGLPGAASGGPKAASRTRQRVPPASTTESYTHLARDNLRSLFDGGDPASARARKDAPRG